MKLQYAWGKKSSTAIVSKELVLLFLSHQAGVWGLRVLPSNLEGHGLGGREGEGWMVLVELGSGVCSPSVRSLHADTRGSRRAGAFCSSCRNGP